MKRIFAIRMGGFVALLSFLTLLLAACSATNTAAPAATTAAAPAATTAASSATTAASGTPAAGATTAASTTGGTTAPTVAPVAGGNKTGVTDTEIKIGSWGPQSGTAAGYGAVDRVIDGYFKMINDNGGINGRKIKFIYEDDVYQAAKTQAIVKKLAEQEKVFAFTGGIGTANNLAVIDYLVENNIPNVAFGTGSGALVNPPKKNIFGMLTNYTFEGTLLAQYAADQLAAKKVAVFYQNDGFGKEGQTAFVKAAKDKKLDVVAEVSYETGATDLSAQALKLQQSGADTVFVNAVPGPGSTLVKEIDKLGYKPKLVMTFVLDDPSFYNNAGKAAEGIITTSFTPLISSDDPKIVKYRDFMKKYLPSEPQGSFSLWGYLAAQVMEEGLKRAGKDLSRESFINAVESITDWKDGLAASITYGPTNRAPIKSAYIIQYKDGKTVKLTEPLEAK